MRWPLRNQILTRMLGLLLLAIMAITVANIRYSLQANGQRERQRMSQIVEMVNSSRFQLTNSVLNNMQSLSGAEFLLVGENGNLLAHSNDAKPLFEVSNGDVAKNEVNFRQRAYFLETMLPGVRSQGVPQGSTLRILLPKLTTSEAWWQASKAPLLIAILAFPIATILGMALAGQVTRPLSILQKQVTQIADGETREVQPVDRQDEIGQLSRAVNEMAEKLKQHESELQESERYRTLLQFGNSAAHHLRNSATGCKMAVELMGESEGIADTEEYQVAIRQLGQIDNYIKRFLVMSCAEQKPFGKQQIVDLSTVLDGVIKLLQPVASHLNVALSSQVDIDDSIIRMAKVEAEQMMANLISNAITAAGQNAATQTSTKPFSAKVDVRLSIKDGRVQMDVADNGSGPSQAVSGTMFEPFVTGSSEGTGLGLSLVKEVAARSGGEVTWRRDAQTTIFTVVLKQSPQNPKAML